VTFTVTPPPTHDLIYTRWTGSAAEIYVLGLGGGAGMPQRMNAGTVSRDPSPSPDGTKFVFAVSQTELGTGKPQNDLFIVNRDGMNVRRLTTADGMEDSPMWSPDGTKILFHATDEQSGPDLWVVNVDGTGLVNLTAGLPADITDKREPSWSADGSRIAFIAARNGQHKVWTMNANGSNAAQLTTDAGFDASPAWSPAGDRIAFSRYNAATPAMGEDIMIVPVAGGAPVRLALVGDQRTPAWSPDGHYIAVSGTTVTGQGIGQIYTMRPDGGGLRLRTTNAAWGGGTSPSWIKRP
jgi:TolB protein